MAKKIGAKKNIDHLDNKEALIILSEHVNKNFFLKKNILNDIKIRNQTKLNSYSYNLIYLTKTIKKIWEVNYTEGTDSTSNINKDEENFINNIKPKEYYKDETLTMIVPNSGVYLKCEKCNGTGTVVNLSQKCSCGNDQNVEPNTTNFKCSKCDQMQILKSQRCICKDGKIRKVLKIQVEFRNKYFNYFYNSCNVPDSYFEKIKGEQIFLQENRYGRVDKIRNFEIPEIIAQSNKVINLHDNTIAQKHFILSYPVWKYDYTLKEENFFLIGDQLKVYAPTYPSRTCSII